MVLTIIETMSILAVVIGVIIAVFGAPSSGPLVRGGTGDPPYHRPLGALFATWPIVPAQALVVGPLGAL